MWLTSLLGNLRSGGTCLRAKRIRRSGPPADPRHRFRPTLESLEDRTLLSSFSASSISDLIADINAANLVGGSNTITLFAGQTFGLTAVDNTTDGATGLPVIAANDRLTIVGNSGTIMRLGRSPAFRLFDVAAGAALTLQDLTLQGGLASGAWVSAKDGAIYSQGALDLNGVTVQGNAAQGQNASGLGAGGQSAWGGGIFSGGAAVMGDGTDGQGNTLYWIADLRFMKGTYRGVDGNLDRTTFVEI